MNLSEDKAALKKNCILREAILAEGQVMRWLTKYKWQLLVEAALGIWLVWLTSEATFAQVPQTISVEPKTHLDWLQALVLGMVQGMTEFLPISSTAHLKAVPVALGWGDPGVTFTAVIQLGSIAAVLWYFWSDVAQITVGSLQAIGKRDYQSSDFRLAVGIALGTLPIVFFGLLIKVFVPDFDNSPLRSMTVIAIASIVMAILLGMAENLGKRKRGFEELSTPDGVLMGLAQALALIPGVSRSGSTITAGLFLSLRRETAARFSFLLGIPAITLAGLVEFKEVIDRGLNNAEVIPLVVGVVSSAFFSYIAIAWLLRYLQQRSTWIFVWYRLIFGVIILMTLWVT